MLPFYILKSYSILVDNCFINISGNKCVPNCYSFHIAISSASEYLQHKHSYKDNMKSADLNLILAK